MWKATVKYRDPQGKVHTRTGHYPVHINSAGQTLALDRTRIIRDLVPAGCTTLKITTKVRQRRKRQKR